MSQNIFEELHDKKSNLIALAQKAVDFGWIPKNKVSLGANTNSIISFEEIKEKLNKDTLTIGVIGQMKCGKSTFLNAFVFEDDVLPAATTPMTAALSVITYGEKERVVAEFYSPDEWAEQKMQASRDENDHENALDLSKIKAAKELVLKSSKLGSQLNSFLGKTQEDKFENLIEYVGADGKYVSITKSVTIYYPKEYLKGVEIVDTPGFNDPIVSREERTKGFLKKADVVVMMLYAGRPFDATDRDIIFKNVSQCGIGKVLIGINKYDIPFCDINHPESADQIKEYVKDEIRKACRECGDETLNEILKETEPIPLSAEMALLSMLPMSKISSSEALHHAWDRHCKGFGISSQNEMRANSHLDDLVAAVKEMVSTEKDKILFTKPLNAILAAGNKKLSDTSTELSLTKDRIELLSLPDTDLEEKESHLEKANKRLTKKINQLGDDVELELQQLVRKGKNELEDLVDQTCQRMRSIVQNEWKRYKSYKSIEPRIDSELDNLITRKLKRATENIATDGKRKIERCIGDFFVDAEDLLMKHVPEFDSRDFVNSLKARIEMDIEDEGLFKVNSNTDDDDYGFWNGVNDFLNGATFGLWKPISNALTHNDDVQSVEKWINSISSSFDPSPYLESAISRKDIIIEMVKRSFIDDLIEKLQDQIKEVRTKLLDRESELKKENEHKTELESLQKNLTIQLGEINEMKAKLI